MKRTPYMARVYIMLAILIIGLPTFIGMYHIHTGKLIVTTENRISRPEKGPFYRSVVFLAHHTLGKAYGVIVNKPMDTAGPFAEIDIESFPDYEDFKKSGLPLYYGGPVNFPDAISVMRVMDGDIQMDIYINLKEENPDILKELASNAEKWNVRLYFGLSVWAPLQLNREIHRGYWGITEDVIHFIYETPTEDIWRGSLLKALEGTPAEEIAI